MLVCSQVFDEKTSDTQVFIMEEHANYNRQHAEKKERHTSKHTLQLKAGPYQCTKILRMQFNEYKAGFWNRINAYPRIKRKKKSFCVVENANDVPGQI